MKKVDYIFSINTGRSGSHYLYTLFTHVQGCCAFHEPEPIGNGEVMRRYLQGDLESMRKFTQKKIDAINTQKGDQIYVETNHCFIKGFGWFIPQHLPEDRIGVIILKRDKSKIARSILKASTSPLLVGGRDWIHTPEMMHPLVTPPKILISPRATYQCARLIKFLLKIMGPYLKTVLRKKFLFYPKWLVHYELECIKWYIDETYEQAATFKKKYPDIKYYEVNIEDLNSFESIQKMLMYFGLNGEEALLNNVIGKPTNLQVGWALLHKSE